MLSQKSASKVPWRLISPTMSQAQNTRRVTEAALVAAEVAAGVAEVAAEVAEVVAEVAGVVPEVGPEVAAVPKVAFEAAGVAVRVLPEAEEAAEVTGAALVAEEVAPRSQEKPSSGFQKSSPKSYPWALQ